MRMLWIALFSFHYKKQINDILSCAAIQARQGDSIMKRITRIIRPTICIVVLLVAMTTAVRGCYQREYLLHCCLLLIVCRGILRAGITIADTFH